MPTELTYEFEFHAAHRLHWHSGACKNLHGHSYRCELTLAGELDVNGVIVDFDDVSEVVASTLMPTVDHTYLNDWLPNPTAELIAAALLELARGAGLPVRCVRLWETRTTSAVVWFT